MKHQRLLIGSLIVLMLLGGAAVLGKRYYPKFNSERLLRKARAFQASKDYQSAAITARRALQVDAQNTAAARLIAEIAEETNSASTLAWKRRMVELEPRSLDNRLALAETALDQGQSVVAEEALRAAGDSGKGNARYHALMGRIALAAKDMPKVEAELAEAVRLEPANETYQLQWQSARLQSSDEAARAQARTALEAMLKQPAVFAKASRVLISDAVKERKADRALALAGELQKSGGAAFEDRLVYLDLLHQLKHPKYASNLASLQEDAAKNPKDLYALIGWLNEHHSALLVVDWVRRLSPELLTTMPVPVALAQSYVRLRNWNALRPIVEDAAANPTRPAASLAGESVEKWGNYEFLRLAFLAAVRRADGDPQQGKVQWQAAVKAAAGRPAAVAALARYAVEWGWDNESAELLWQVARNSSDPMWALRILYRDYEQARSASNLKLVATRILELESNNRDMKNNLAMLDLLLGSNVAEAVETARALHQTEPKNADYLSTYALGLHLQGFSQRAVDLMKTLSPEKLEHPSIAAYYGVVLSATDAKEQSRKLLESARDAKLLPEEKRLVNQALERLAAPAAAPVQ